MIFFLHVFLYVLYIFNPTAPSFDSENRRGCVCMYEFVRFLAFFVCVRAQKLVTGKEHQKQLIADA